MLSNSTRYKTETIEFLEKYGQHTRSHCILLLPFVGIIKEKIRGQFVESISVVEFQIQIMYALSDSLDISQFENAEIFCFHRSSLL